MSQQIKEAISARLRLAAALAKEEQKRKDKDAARAARQAQEKAEKERAEQSKQTANEAEVCPVCSQEPCSCEQGQHITELTKGGSPSSTLHKYMTAAHKKYGSIEHKNDPASTAKKAKLIAGVKKAYSKMYPPVKREPEPARDPNSRGYERGRYMGDSTEYNSEMQIDEAVSVKTQKFDWGKMMTVHHGSDTSYPLHPEHQAAIKKLRPGMKTTFKDETNSTVHAHREGDTVHLSRPSTSSTLTSLPYHHFDTSEHAKPAARKPAGEYDRKVVAHLKKKYNEETEQMETLNTFKGFRASLLEKTLTPAEKKKREEVAQAIEREHPGMPMGMKMAIATKTAKRVAEDTEQVVEEVKTTHDNPLVVVHKNGELWTHANLSVANQIHNTNVKADAVHKGTVKHGNMTFSISKHHAKAMEDEKKFKDTYGE